MLDFLNTGTQQLSYFNTKAISNSLMGVYEDDWDQFVAYWVYGNPLKQFSDDSLTMGTIVDTILTAPDSVEGKFHIFDGVAPTAQTLKFITECSKNNCNFEVAYEVVKAQNGGKLQKDINKFKELFEENKAYYDVLMSAGKTVVSTPMMQKANQIVQEAKSHRFTKTLVNAATNDSIEVHHQIEVFPTLFDIPCKGAIDKLIIDHSKKRIIPIDYKTSSNAVKFKDSVLKYRYYRQGSFYKRLLKFWLEEKGLQDYMVMDFVFVVFSTTRSNHHFVFRMTPEDTKIAEIGGYTHQGDYVKGWQEILQEIEFHTKENDWSYPYEILSSNGIVELDIFKKD